MAIEENPFINTNGEEISVSNLVNQMINYYYLKLEVGETKVTDFNEGSEIRNLLEAFAICIYALLEEQHEATKITFISSSYGTWLDRIGELPFINLPRITGNIAEGSVTFTLATAQQDDVVIPENTILVCSDSGLEFYTVQECTISAGELSETVSAESLSDGYDNNVPANSIDTIVSDTLNTELISVNNASAFENGSDEEDDEEYRTRMLKNVQADGFGTQGWYKNLCESVNGVHDILLVDTSGYTKEVVVNGYNKPITDDVLLNVLVKLTDLKNKVLNHNFIVSKPLYSTIDLTITLNVATVINNSYITDTLTAFFNGGSSITQAEFDGLNINQSVTKDDLINTLQIFDDIIEVTSIKQSGTEITTLSPLPNGVLKLGTVSITQNEV